MEGFPEILEAIDPWLIWAFRLPQRAELGFALGQCWVALAATLVGELSSRLIIRCNYKYFKGLREDMVKNHNLSLRALALQDKASYKASNTLAHDAFGKYFFAQLALNASSLWTVPFALGWLDYRFPGLKFPFPLAGEVGTPFLFIPTYIAVRILFAGLLRRFARKRAPGEEEPQQMLRMDDLVNKPDQEPRD